MPFISNLWEKIPAPWKEAAKQGPLAGVLLVALSGYMSGKWISAAGCQALRDADGKETVELRAQRDWYRDLSVRGTQTVQKEAIEQIKKVEAKPTPVPAKPKPTPVITATEKREVTKPIANSDPATLEKTLNASQQVLEKTKKP